MKQGTLTTKQLIAKLQKLDPDGNKKVCLEKAYYGFSDGTYYIQDRLTDGAIRVDDKNNNIIKITMY